MDEGKKLDALVKKSHRELFEASTVFPFDPFPDTIRIDENKIDIIYRNFFYNKHIVSLMVDDINTVILSSGVLFASVHIQLNKARPPALDEFLSEPIKYLWKRDAIRIRRIVLGLIVAKRGQIDVAKIPTHELAAKVEEIGKAQEFPQV